MEYANPQSVEEHNYLGITVSSNGKHQKEDILNNVSKRKNNKSSTFNIVEQIYTVKYQNNNIEGRERRVHAEETEVWRDAVADRGYIRHKLKTFWLR